VTLSNLIGATGPKKTPHLFANDLRGPTRLAMEVTSVKTSQGFNKRTFHLPFNDDLPSCPSPGEELHKGQV
jgi:hypothetical protein